MIYPDIVFATFVERPNRFIARVIVDGESAETVVHVKNTGRCRELLVPGCRVVLARGTNPARKTPFDLVAVYKVTPEHPEGWLFNIDSQAPNAVVGEWLRGEVGEDAGATDVPGAVSTPFSLVRPEYTFGQSRVDFYLERPGTDGAAEPTRYLLEVKGCTLEIDGIGYFPDAPTTRGVKHLRELTAAASRGYTCAVAFVIAMEGVTEVRAAADHDPAFAAALTEAENAGVRILPLTCAVTPNSLRITSPLSAVFPA